MCCTSKFLQPAWFELRRWCLCAEPSLVPVHEQHEQLLVLRFWEDLVQEALQRLLHRFQRGEPVLVIGRGGGVWVWGRMGYCCYLCHC